MSTTSGERRLLALCRLANADTIQRPDWQTTLQSVKAALFDRDYNRAFGSHEHRAAYIARWVPARALMFRKLLQDEVLPHAIVPSALSIVALGAGSTSELLALASLAADNHIKLNDILLLDTADWSSSVDHIESWITKPEKECGLSHNGRLLFRQVDCLNLDDLQSVFDATESRTQWFTIFFTIHELLLQSRANTIAMLGLLSSHAHPADLLIIIESASLSTIEANGKTYQLGLLLDHVLTKNGDWQCIKAHDRCVRCSCYAVRDSTTSLWYRIPQSAKALYPIPLENSRVFLRVYQRLGKVE